jgi:alkylation response protein AidB-like acyl-CoA dehydrogenase
MYSLHLSPEQLQIRDTVREFVAQEIKPLALKPERLEAHAQPLLVNALEKASQIGLRTLALAEELGGAGADNLTCCIVTEELAVGDPDVAAVLAQTSLLAHALFDQLMTPEQRARFLPGFLADHRYHLALAEHEADRDTALGINYRRPQASEARFKTTAVRAGDTWIINGRKHRVADASLAGLFAVRASLGENGAGTLLVPRDTPGLRVTTSEASARWDHGACGALIFENCRVPARLGGFALCRYGPSHPPGSGHQPRHRPRRLRGRPRLRAAARARRTPHHRASGDRRKARRDRGPARGGARGHLAGGLGIGPSGRLRRPQPARPAA